MCSALLSPKTTRPWLNYTYLDTSFQLTPPPFIHVSVRYFSRAREKSVRNEIESIMDGEQVVVERIEDGDGEQIGLSTECRCQCAIM